MLQFLNPIWLFAIAAVAIPVAIHLWNIRPGKVLKVGSISLMDAASRKSSRSFKLLDIPLFILRCLLLILLAFILAIPLWHKKLEPGKAKGWILIPKESFTTVYQKFGKRIDSLNDAGYETHFFNTGFAKTDLKKVLADTKDSLKSTLSATADYWNLIRQLDTTVSSTLSVYVFSANQADHFKGTRPQVALDIHWQTYTPADSTATWIAGAWFNSNNTIRVVQGTSTPSGTSYSYTNMITTDQANSSFNVSVDNGQTIVSLKTGNTKPVIVDTAALRIAIYTDNNTADANYLQAALNAVSQFMQRKTVVKQYSNTNAIPAGQTWLFWLSDKPSSSKLLQNSSHVFQYQIGKVINTASWLSNEGSYSVALNTEQKVDLFKLVPASSTNQNVLWRDGFGHTILSEKQEAHTQIYNFYSHFNPTWNDLVWSNEFPSWIMNLMVSDKADGVENYDKRILATQQLMPANISAAHNVSVKTTGTYSLVNYFWLALALVFLAERWLANKTQNLATNG